MSKAMKSKAVLYGLVGLAVIVASSPARAQESGADVWARSCGRCHRLQPPNKYDADSWRAIMGHMALNARLTSEEEEAVRDFLMGAARPLSMETEPQKSEPVRLASSDPTFVPISQGESGADLYGKHCAACHGKQGKGNGPAAVALTPRPSDLTDAERMAQLSDEELLEIIAKGKRAMPGFSAILKPEELAAVAAYVRNLSVRN